MIATIRHAEDGWGDYVRNGTKLKPRDKNLIEEIGDTKFGDELCRGGYYSVVLGFKGKLTNKEVKNILKEWVKLFMHGYEFNEYYYDAMIHQDTDDTHVHIRFSDMNIYTGTKLQFFNYAFKPEMKRKDLIQDYLDQKYGLESPKDNGKAIMKECSFEHLQEWRDSRKDKDGKSKPVSFKHKKERDAFRKMVYGLLESKVVAGDIKGLYSVRNLFDEKSEVDEFRDFKIVKEGFDRKRNEPFFTIEDKSGNKTRLYGHFFSQEFWDKPDWKREKILQNGTVKKDWGLVENTPGYLKRDLDYLNEQRKEFLEKRYEKSRKREKEKYIEFRDGSAGSRASKRKMIEDYKKRMERGEEVDLNIPVVENWKKFLIIYQSEQNEKIAEREAYRKKVLKNRDVYQEKQKEEEVKREVVPKPEIGLPFEPATVIDKTLEPVPEPQKDIEMPAPVQEISSGVGVDGDMYFDVDTGTWKEKRK